MQFCQFPQVVPRFSRSPPGPQCWEKLAKEREALLAAPAQNQTDLRTFTDTSPGDSWVLLPLAALPDLPLHLSVLLLCDQLFLPQHLIVVQQCPAPKCGCFGAKFPHFVFPRSLDLICTFPLPVRLLPSCPNSTGKIRGFHQCRSHFPLCRCSIHANFLHFLVLHCIFSRLFYNNGDKTNYGGKPHGHPQRPPAAESQHHL